MKEVSRYSQEELLFEIYLLWLDSQFRPSLGARLKQIVEEQSPELVAAWLAKEICMVKKASYEQAHRDLAEAQRLDVHVLHYLSNNYPAYLREIADPPLVIFIKSHVNFNLSQCSQDKLWKHGRIVGVVGSRKCSANGMENARCLGADIIAAGGVVVSGLALGVDQYAHEGALETARRMRISGRKEAGCPTVAVIGSGLSHIYPKSNEWLAHAIVESGGMVLSEFGMNTTPRKHYFPQRNRLISGLSDVVIVVEARKRSGALITARLALEQGKEVLSVPGQIKSPFSEGTNHLIKQGAFPYTGIEDLINPEICKKEMIVTSNTCLKSTRYAEAPVSSPYVDVSRQFSKDEKLVCEFIAQHEHVTVEKICENIELSMPLVLGIISILELEGVLEKEAYDCYRLL